jgi:hypothetical protein
MYGIDLIDFRIREILICIGIMAELTTGQALFGKID